MGRKGISPLIAAVMLLAFAMAVGGMFSEWSGEMVRDSTTDAKEDQTQILDCTGKTIEIDKVYTNDNWVNVTLRADGGNLGDVAVTLFPKIEQKTVDLSSAGVIDTASFQINEEQDRITAASTECGASVEYDLRYD